MFCNRCGTANRDDVRFCRNCGGPLVKPDSPEASPASPEYKLPGFVEPAQPGYQPYQSYQGRQTYPVTPSSQVGASGRAIASMILSLVSIVTCGPFMSIPGLILGKMELDAIRSGQAPPGGETFAKIGYYAGIAITALSCLAGIAYAVFFLFMIGAPH